MPLFLHALVAWSRRRPAVALLGIGLLGWLHLWTPDPVTARHAARAWPKHRRYPAWGRSVP